MAFVATTSQPSSRWFSSHVKTSQLSDDFTHACDSCKSHNIDAVNCRGNRTHMQNNTHILTQSATHLNYDTFRLPTAALHSRVDSHRATPHLDQSCSQRMKRCTESIQHRSMIELDESRDTYYSIAVDSPVVRNQSQIRWIRRRINSPGDVTQSSSCTPTSGFMRFTIQDLIQQESCVGSASYSIDQPSKLVRIECRKPGCRCVLKNEPAMALKIVSGLAFVQGHWLLPSKSEPISPLNLLVQNSFMVSKLRGQLNTGCKIDPNPVVLTSCCPSWFELISRSSSGDSTHVQFSEVPIWSSAKALWRAKPRVFLLRKAIHCLVGSVTSPFPTVVDDTQKTNQPESTLDTSNMVTLRAGTVLELLDCRAYRLIRHYHTGSSGTAGNLGGSLLHRQRGKTVTMLQCAVVGAKSLVPVASVATDLLPKDGLQWLADGPRLIYIPLDCKPILCSPVATHATHQSGSSQTLSLKGSNSLNNNGVHSLLSILMSSRLPSVVRPLTGLKPNEWFSLERMDRRFAVLGEISSQEETPLLLLEKCYHGDLIFLEPLADCTDPTHDSRSVMNQSHPNMSRFFVVTTDMLVQHNFFLADTTSTEQYGRQLELHACRVANFLTACHPAQGLAYLIKHLEDISRTLDTGPSLMPLTRTLGPVSSAVKYASIQAVMMSVAAAATLATENPGNFISDQPSFCERDRQSDLSETLIIPWSASSLSSIDRYQSSGCLLDPKTSTHSSLSSSLIASEVDQMNALCDEIEDIYFYVRNGRFPTQSRSMTSLVHHVTPVSRVHRPVPQCSAPLSPKTDDLFPEGPHVQRTFCTRDYSKNKLSSTKSPGFLKTSQPSSGFPKRTQPTPQLYVSHSIPAVQVPVFTVSQGALLDTSTLIPSTPSMKNHTDISVTTAEPVNSPTKTNVVRVFQSPAHDSGVDTATYRTLEKRESPAVQSPHPFKLYTNTRVLTMSNIGPDPDPSYHIDNMSQSQITSSQQVTKDAVPTSQNSKRSTDSVSAFRLQAPRGTSAYLNYIDPSTHGRSMPLANSSKHYPIVHENQYHLNCSADANNVHHHIADSFNPSVCCPAVSCIPENLRTAKSPLRVINLRSTDSQSFDQTRNGRVLCFNYSQPTSSVTINPPNTANVNTQAYRICAPAADSHHVPSFSSSAHRPIDSTSVHSPDSQCRKGRMLSTTITRHHPQPVFVMLNQNAMEERPLSEWNVDSGVAYVNQMSCPIANVNGRYGKYRSELINSSPDTGIGGDSVVELPCTSLLAPSNACPTSARVNKSDRMGQSTFVHPSYQSSANTTRQVYQV